MLSCTNLVYPACAGIDLERTELHRDRHSLPRMRGDRPSMRPALSGLVVFTPHARGSTYPFDTVRDPIVVYPACAGIDHPHRDGRSPGLCLPRMRGDRPQTLSLLAHHAPFTPHARGSTGDMRGDEQNFIVYPACAGIDLARRTRQAGRHGLPRMRGDRP